LSPARAHKIRVLFVEDAVDHALLVQTFLAPLPEFEVTHTQDGDQALQLIEQRDWDLLIADLNVPGADGFTVIRAAKTRNRHLPVLATTAYTQEHYWDQAFRSGADQVMVKPLRQEEFLARIRTMLGSAKRARATGRETIVVAEGLLGDGVMGCGGTALIASRTGTRVVLLPLLADPLRIDAAELEAAKVAARGMGVGFKVAEALVSAPGRTAEVLHRVVAELAPTTLYVPARGDAHAARAAATRAATEAGDGQTRILGYQTATSPAGFAPDRFVDVREQLPVKAEALGAFRKLGKARRDLDPAMARAYARYWGRFKDFSEVEAFELIQDERMTENA